MKILIIPLILITCFVILISIFVILVSTSFPAEPPAISSIEPPDPLFLIYQKLKIGNERQRVYDIVNKYYPGHMAVIHYESGNYETWNWNWPPEQKNSLKTAYLGIEFFDDKVSDAFYKYVSPKRVEIKRLYKITK
ncbi:MAG: hypothetical protein HYW34_02395 [Candidatus Brennerbacteria bacterium]|nr:hypothetical protein [Candidatus Brennerbacteria bacterium]